jgi:hypothetical protein
MPLRSRLCALMWWHLTRVLPHMKDEALSPAGFVMEQINVTTGTEAQCEKIRTAVEPLLSLTDELHEWEAEYLATASERIGMPEADDRLTDWLPLPADTFVTRCTKLLDGRRTAQTLSALVEDAYALTPDERTLLHATRPVRDPLDVLRARIGADAPLRVEAEGGEPGEGAC